MPAGRETCPVHRDHPEGGWYHVVGGGYVCVGGALAVPYPSRGVRRPAQPILDAGMPYQYAVVYGTPIMYREPPSEDTLRVYEPWRFRHEQEAGAPAEATDPAAAPSESNGTAATPSEPASANTNSANESGSAAGAPTPAADTRRDRAHANANASSGTSATQAAAPAATSAETPNGEPTLRDLRGDRGGPVVRRLLRGMYLSLDRTVTSRATGDRYWRTQSGGFVREGPLSILHTAPTFTGVELDGTEHTLPLAFMVSLTGWDYRLTANNRGASQHHRVPRLTAIQLSNDPPVEIGARTYWRTSDGLAVDARNVRVATLRTPPAGTGEHERWIDVDLDQQILVAYEGARPVYVTLVSTGRRTGEELERFETPAGSFRIRGKHVATTMDGDTASDGPYSIEDVPWAQYFYESYALHGAFWHNNFGWRMSHGCVNLSPPDARWLFFWTDPQVPEGWHGVFASPDHPGSRIELHHGSQPTPSRPTL
jgi:lipoprotein-anchoring transpeptidase ErfK/SrfK